VDARSDVFSLAAVAYRALTGRRPFNGKALPQILYQIVYGAPTRPREIVPTLPESVEAVLGKGLAKRPQDRSRSAKDFAEALRAAVTDLRSPADLDRAARTWKAQA
jgi:serine/threonine-protein kinase